jgi:hypothetical protein
VDLLLSKGVVDNHSFHKVSHSFPKVVPSEIVEEVLGVAIIDNIGLVREILELPLSTILGQQSKWEDIHPEWYFLTHVPN